MIPGLTSIIIPTYQHAGVLPEAIESALAQSVPVEVIVVDDGSTDGTRGVVERYGERVRSFERLHNGPSRARNTGIDAAQGEFVMFLDADDVIDSDKVAEQVAVLNARPEAGWCLCDVRIIDVGGKADKASSRYGYPDMDLSGWIQPLLGARNFIPIMSPLVRASVLEGIRFNPDARPEDWHFWHAVAGVARVRYVPRLLATYRKRRGSRNASPKPTLPPGVVPPLRLNLGCGTPGALSWHPQPGMMNLDKSLGWKFEDGLRDFADGSVSGITVSHSLMYVAIDRWPFVFGEFARVLQPGGVLRITEDDATNPSSSRFGGWKGSEPAVTLIDAKLVLEHMERAGLRALEVTAHATYYHDPSLMQAQHGASPDVFFVEGVRESCVLLSPHADDETLFAAFTILRHHPRVVICFPSTGDYGDTATRLEESRAAVEILGGGPVDQWYTSNIEFSMRELDRTMRPTRVFAPSAHASHPEHVAVALAAESVFGDRLVRYQTYDTRGKVRTGDPVAFEQEWIGRKREALACYRTQWSHPRACKFFDDDLAEYRAP